MKQVGIVTLISVAASAASPSSHTNNNSATFETNKSVAQFGNCFVAAQDRAARPWSFVPRSNGGTFSNAGAKAAGPDYFLAISDGGQQRVVRLEPASATTALDANIARAVDRCV